MIFYILLSCILPLTTTEAVSTVQPKGAQMSTFKVVTGPFSTVQPRTEKLSEILTLSATTKTAAPVTPIQNMPNQETTNFATNNVQTSARNSNDLTTPATESNAPSTLAVKKSKMLVALTTSNMDATATTTDQTISVQATVVKSSDRPTSIVQRGEPLKSTTKSMQTTILSGIASTTSLILSSQTIQMKEETTILSVLLERPTTKVYPTAKLSATTQNTATRVLKTSAANTREPFVPIRFTTKENENGKHSDRNKSEKNGKIVAGLIGGALILMMIGFLVILYKKHKLKKHQIATSEWAGPTPFLDTGTDNGHVTLRSSNRISLTSFLPQRLSKRLSLLPEVGEEMQELTTGTTFGGKEVKKEGKNDKTLVNETSQKNGKAKLNEEETAKSKEPDNVQVQTNEEENGQSENTPTQPATVEDPPKEPHNDKTEEAESNGPDLV